MLASNQPYQRVDKDSVWNGALLQATSAAATVGGMHAYMNKMDNAVKNNTVKPGSMGEQFVKTFGTNELSQARKFMGTGKGKLAAYGGSVLLGGMGGAMTDAMI